MEFGSEMASLEEIPTYKRFWTYCNKQNDRNGITPLKMSAMSGETTQGSCAATANPAAWGPTSLRWTKWRPYD